MNNQDYSLKNSRQKRFVESDALVAMMPDPLAELHAHLTRLVEEWVGITMTHFSSVEEECFERMVLRDGKLQLPSRLTIRRRILEEVSSTKDQMLILLSEAIGKISFTTDVSS